MALPRQSLRSCQASPLLTSVLAPSHSVDIYEELDGAISGTKTAVSADRERELRCGVAEARAGDDGHAVKFSFAFDDGRQGVRVRVGRPLELPENYAPHAPEAR